MEENYNLCIVKPNKLTYSETFINAHITRLSGTKKVLYGGAFPVFKEDGSFLITSKINLLIYLIEKRIFNKKEISVSTKALVDYLQKENINIVLAEYGFVGAMISSACRLANVPLVIHFHGADAHHKKTVENYFTLYHKAFGYASAIIVVSEDMKAALIKLGANPEKLILNPYGVDLELFSEVNVKASSKNFLSVGRFVEKKAPLTTIKAFNQVASSHPDSRLWMVGDGPLLNEAKALTQELALSKNIIFTGILPPEEIANLMQQMRCYVQHSVTAKDGDMEGTPNSILEASAAGLPIISTRHAGIKEAVIHEKTGLLVDEFDINKMGKYMLRIANDQSLAVELGKNGRSHILKNYNIKDRINNLDKILHDFSYSKR